MLKQELKQKLQQKLTPQQIQVIRLLEIPTYLLEQKIKKEIEENPVLEEGFDKVDDSIISEEETNEETDFTNNEEDQIENNDLRGDEDDYSVEYYIQDDDIPYYKLSANNHSSDDKHPDIPYSVGISFQDYLENQLGLRMLDEKQNQLGLYLIGNLDDDGYLRRDIQSIVDDLAINENIETTIEEIEKVLLIIQDLEPLGVGARNLQECLVIQLQKQNDRHLASKLALQILKEHFEEFTKKHYDKIIHSMAISEKNLKQAIDEILKLNPKPGSSYNGSESKGLENIIPDFTLEIRDGQFALNINSKNVPELRISKTYQKMAESGKNITDKEAILFVKQKISSAKWFIDAIKQRQETLMTTMHAIIHFQKEYFIIGDESKLKPMILKDIAEITGYDISTISRVANSKYIQTHFGIFPLKYFFSEGMQNDSGEEISTREIKNILKECIDAENKKKPLNDEKLVLILKEKGYVIARRTVAKYREQLDIPVARLRKELK